MADDPPFVITLIGSSMPMDHPIWIPTTPRATLLEGRSRIWELPG